MKSFEKVVSFGQLEYEALRAPHQVMQGLLLQYPEAAGGDELNPVPAEISKAEPAYGMLALYVNYHRCVDISLRFLSRELKQSNLRGWDLLDVGLQYRESIVVGHDRRHNDILTGRELLAHPIYSKVFTRPIVDYVPLGAVHVVGDVTPGVSPVKLQVRLDPNYELIRSYGSRLQVVKSFSYDSVSSYVDAQYRANAYLEQMKAWELVHTHRNGLR